MLLTFFISCGDKECEQKIKLLSEQNDFLVQANGKYSDTLQLLRVQLDSLNSGGMQACADENKRLNAINDSLSTNLFLANYKVEKVKFYLAICLRDKTQDKFLKGWVRRAVE